MIDLLFFASPKASWVRPLNWFRPNVTVAAIKVKVMLRDDRGNGERQPGDVNGQPP
jgi:hypothetical protein